MATHVSGWRPDWRGWRRSRPDSSTTGIALAWGLAALSLALAFAVPLLALAICLQLMRIAAPRDELAAALIQMGAAHGNGGGAIRTPYRCAKLLQTRGP
jgi:hypothetical protein